MYKGKLGCLHLTIVTVEKHEVLHIICVFVALVIQQAMRMRHIVICDLSSSALYFFQIFS